RELAWREFYADVLFHRPDSARRSLQPAMAAMEVDEGPEADRRFAAWAEGRTGYPIVDAGMRQLSAEAWMHNRVRMIVASFLVKDLHLDWSRGARHFMRLLVDGDLASNQHGWQWVAGTGTDPAPYFRVFNPVLQGEKFDPDGDYVRRWVPELAAVGGGAVHRPWTLPGGPPGLPRAGRGPARPRPARNPYPRRGPIDGCQPGGGQPVAGCRPPWTGRVGRGRVGTGTATGRRVPRTRGPLRPGESGLQASLMPTGTANGAPARDRRSARRRRRSPAS